MSHHNACHYLPPVLINDPPVEAGEGLSVTIVAQKPAYKPTLTLANIYNLAFIIYNYFCKMHAYVM